MSKPFCIECGKEMQYIAGWTTPKSPSPKVKKWVCVDCKKVSNAPPPRQTVGDVLVYGSKDPVTSGSRFSIIASLVLFIVGVLCAVWWLSLFR